MPTNRLGGCGKTIGSLPCCSLLRGNAWELLSLLPSSSVSCIISDPPYDARTHLKAHTNADVSSKVDGVAFSSFTSLDISLFVREALRVSKGWVIAFAALEALGDYAKEAGPSWIRSGVWVKRGAPPQFTGDRPAQGADGVAIMHGLGRKQWNGGGSHAVWEHHSKIREGKVHPTQKPLDLMEKLVTLFSNEDDVILDPFSGSGTTAIACTNLGRHFLCFEKDAEFHRIACTRYQTSQQQLTVEL